MLGGVAAVGTSSARAVLAQAPLVVKMQTSRPASDIWMDLAREYTTRVEEMSGGRLQMTFCPGLSDRICTDGHGHRLLRLFRPLADVALLFPPH